MTFHLRIIILCFGFVASLFSMGLHAQLSNERPISEYLYGINAWMPNLQGLNGQFEQLVPTLGTANIKLIRIGGINFDFPDLQQLSNDEYIGLIQQIRSIGAEPIVQLPKNWADPGQEHRIASLINAINEAVQPKVKFYSLGNEPDHAHKIEDAFEVAAYCKILAQHAKEADPEITIFGPEWAYFYPGPFQNYYHPFFFDNPHGIWSKVPGKDYYYIDIFTFHSYSVQDSATFERWLTEEILPGVDHVNSNYRDAGDQISWALSEFHINYFNEAFEEKHKVWSFYAGQFFAEVYWLAAKYGGFSVLPWSVHESGANRSGGDLSVFDGNNGNYTPRSTFEHIRLMASSSKANYIASHSPNGDVKVLASRDERGLSIALLNISDNTHLDFNLSLNGQAQTTSAVNLAVSAGIGASFEGSLPAQTTKIYQLLPNGAVDCWTTYDAAMYANNSGPSSMCAEEVIEHELPGKFEAELYSHASGVMLEASADTGGGQNVGWIDEGDWIEYKVNVAVDGRYRIDFRLASLEGGQEIIVKADGVEFASAIAPMTGDWQNWETVSIDADLLSGAQTLRLEPQAGGFNINWLDFRCVQARELSNTNCSGTSIVNPPENDAPVVNVIIRQAGELVTAVDPNAGVVTLVAEVEDETTINLLSFNWSLNNLLGSQISHNSVSFDPKEFTAGEYTFSVVVEDDGVPSQSTNYIGSFRVRDNSAGGFVFGGSLEDWLVIFVLIMASIGGIRNTAKSLSSSVLIGKRL